MAKRLVVALVASILLAFVCFSVLPRYGVTIPPFIPLLAFVLMVAASIAVEFENDKDEEDDNPFASESFAPDDWDDGVPDDARPIGCSGPRPVGEASRRRGCGPSCGC